MIRGKVRVLSWCVDQGVPCERGTVEPGPGASVLLRFEELSRIHGGVVYVEVTKYKHGGGAGRQGLARVESPGRVP